MADNGIQLPDQVLALLQEFEIPRERLVKLSEDIENEFQQGLKGSSNTSIPMLPSYVPSLPTGNGKITYNINDYYKNLYDFNLFSRNWKVCGY